MGKQPKTISANQALEQMRRACSRKECCIFDIRRKLDRMCLSESEVNEIINNLIEERYIDEERYARSYINDKLRFNKWGKKKIEFALYQKQLPRSIVEKVFSEYTDADISGSLPEILERKWASTSGNSAYEKESKLIRYALGRGFIMDDILRILEEIKRSKQNDNE